jgi:hypothetical protein
MKVNTKRSKSGLAPITADLGSGSSFSPMCFQGMPQTLTPGAVLGPPKCMYTRTFQRTCTRSNQPTQPRESFTSCLTIVAVDIDFAQKEEEQVYQETECGIKCQRLKGEDADGHTHGRCRCTSFGCTHNYIDFFLNYILLSFTPFEDVTPLLVWSCPHIQSRTRHTRTCTQSHPNTHAHTEPLAWKEIVVELETSARD